MSNFNVPTRDEVSENNQAIFDNLEKGVDLFHLCRNGTF
jgi:hypothetical protein